MSSQRPISSPKIIGSSAGLRRAKARIDEVAATKAPVLISGETGTGKELLAARLHAHSKRFEGPLVELNCAAIPPDLVESELFGHERGAFTGSGRQRAGKFELADGGTLFLDEVGEMPLAAQAKLLRVLQDGRVWRVGSEEPRVVDVRVVAATNRDLSREISAGRFREDLYYRLAMVEVVVPPLRERKADIGPLVEHFAESLAEEWGVPVRGVSEEAKGLMRDLPWPGNVRSLANAVGRLVIFSRDAEEIGASEVRRVLGLPVPERSLFDSEGERGDEAVAAPERLAQIRGRFARGGLGLNRATTDKVLAVLDEYAE